MVFIFAAEPFAFWIWQSSLYLVQSALRALGSAGIQRGEEVVSGRMMPPFAPLPSMVPPAPPLAGVEAGALADELPPGGGDAPDEGPPPPPRVGTRRRGNVTGN